MGVLDVPAPQPVKTFTAPTFTIAAFNASTPIPFSMNRAGTKIYSLKTGGYVSSDGGTTWQGPIFNTGQSVGFDQITGLWELDDGEVLVAIKPGAAAGYIYKSSGFATWAQGSPVAGSTVLTASATGCYFQPYWVMGQAGAGMSFAITEYGTQGVAAKGWLTRDFGSSYTQVFSLADINGGTIPTGDHVHAMVWDPYENCLWLTHGDQVNRILRSDDFGATWNTVHFRDNSDGVGQVAAVLPLPSCVLFVTDGAPWAILKYERTHRGTIVNPALARQEIKITGTPTGGTITPSYRGQATSALTATTLDAPTLQAALEGLSTIGATRVTVTGTNPTFVVELESSLAPHKPITVASALTGGSSPSVAVRSVQRDGAVLDTIRLFTFGGSGKFLGQGVYRARGIPGAPAILCIQPSQSNATGKSLCIMTVDGKTFHRAYIDASAPGSDKGIASLFGPDANGVYYGAYGGASGLQAVTATAPVFPTSEVPMATR